MADSGHETVRVVGAKGPVSTVGSRSHSQEVFCMDLLSERARSLPASPIREMMARAATIRDAVRLEMGEPDFTTPLSFIEQAFRAAREGATHYTPTTGLPALRQAVARHYERDYGIPTDPESEVMVTVGAVGALAVACLAILEPGDEAILPDPGWPVYRSQVLLAGARPVPVPLREELAFHLQAEDVEERVTPRTRAVFINSPHNPTGAVLSETELRALGEVAYRHGLTIISDEVYEHILYDGRRNFCLAAIPELRDRVITVSGVSKTYAMTGWRVGYVRAAPGLVAAMARIQECLASCPASISQQAALAALTGDQSEVEEMVGQYAFRRRLLVDGLNRLPGVSCRLPEGAFYAFPNVKRLGRPSAHLSRELLERTGVVTVPGAGFGAAGEGYLRLSYAASPATLEEALQRLGRYLENQSELTEGNGPLPTNIS